MCGHLHFVNTTQTSPQAAPGFPILRARIHKLVLAVKEETGGWPCVKRCTLQAPKVFTLLILGGLQNPTQITRVFNSVHQSRGSHACCSQMKGCVPTAHHSWERRFHFLTHWAHHLTAHSGSPTGFVKKWMHGIWAIRRRGKGSCGRKHSQKHLN